MKCKIYRFKSLKSTQDKAKEFSKKGLKNIVIVADAQIKGRGRFKRKWHSAKGGLWMSILLSPKKAENLQYLTFAAAIAVVKSIKKMTGISTKIKWPNDVHYNGRKLCGILTEGIFPANYAVIGIGVNVNQSKFPNEIKNTAISLKMIKNQTIYIKKLIRNILYEFFNLYNNYYNKNKFEKISKIWKMHCDTINRDVTAITRAGRLSGKAIGIDEEGSLLLKTGKSNVVKVAEGDISIRY
ncbi:biotin--[acetyl-CoA-carboxylase] ligase [Candidatus Woesearchaeota archaeon]|nr:biotin--[acetyl-CoA-carboxylase] ligase [Candidatus Woesearchaeota archaeon]